MNRALRRISIASLVMFAVLLLNVNYLQAFQADSLTSKPSNVRAFEQQFQQQRGQIVAADGTVLAKSVATKNVIYKFQRQYPHGPEYAPVTGYDSIFGASGLELTEDKLLSGNDPRLLVRNFVNMITGKKPQGAQVVTTIDPRAQTAAYKNLLATGLSGGVVALDPKTGAILALASAPSFNPNNYATFSGTKLNKIDTAYRQSPAQPLLNRAINETYPPGSTFKVVTSSTLFSSGKYTPDTVVPAPTVLQLPDSTATLINFDGEACGTGSVPIIYAFTVSCNTVFGGLGMKIGGPALHDQATKFGMNDPNLTIPLPVSESNMPLLTNDPPHVAQSAIGQFDDTVTPLQEAMFSATIANGGTLMKPYLVQKVEAQDLSSVEAATQQSLSQPVSGAVAGEVKRMMLSVVQSPSGTAHAATASLQNSGIEVGAKTGTAQNGINNTGLDDAVFTCFAQSGNQQIAVGVVVKGGGQGADAAAPIAVAVIKAYLGQQ
ncbi:MAG TPA: penicillin-binding transpeptidase domain-containing protein [Streptosporangiaceae bacterium]|nr:penicillin-binding transpeptidase domain-containing protein [Streptosporangiaceae bacterium]